MTIQCKDPTFIPIAEFERDPEMHVQKLKPGECFWEWSEPVGPWRTIDGVAQRDVRRAGVVIGPMYKPKS